MRAVVQRVSEASVYVDGAVTGRIGHGLLALIGVANGDEPSDADAMAKKLARLRIFNDEAGKFNRSVQDIGGAVLIVSQFTLLGDARKGNRPSFIDAARPETAVPLYERVGDALRSLGLEVAAGVFGAHMDVHLINDGPVTILLDSSKRF